ncbi:MAG: hypothetical protein WC284_16810 [Candidimonas sp.]
MKTSIVLMTNTHQEWEVTGDPVRADGWFGWKDGIHTVSMSVRNFTGRIFIEASLATDPTDNDWFPIWLTQTTPYVQFPQIPSRPTSDSTEIGPVRGDTATIAYTMRGNFMWIRAKMERSYLGPTPDKDKYGSYGVVEQILLNN